jgi:hypothetical protein
VRLSNGNYAVIDKNRVQYFDARGKRLQIVGRSGAGPEEFGWLTGICRTRGDTVVVRDERNARLAVLDGDGRIVRTIRYQALGMPDTHHCFDDGTLALALRSAWRDAGQAGTQQITRVRLDGSPVNEIGRFETPPYDPLTSMFLHVRATGQRLYVGDPRTGDVRVYTPAGKLATIIRSADPPVRIPRDMIEAQMKRNLPTAPVARLSAAQYWPTWPAYRDLQIDARGTLWVEDFNRDILKPDGWTAFDTQGRLVGRLIIPAPAKGDFPVIVRAVSADQIMIWRLDQDHFPHLTLFPLVRESAGGR